MFKIPDCGNMLQCSDYSQLSPNHILVFAMQQYYIIVLAFWMSNVHPRGRPGFAFEL
jgi:hypothetical protein